VQESLEEKIRAGDSVNGNAEGQWNNIKKCLLDTTSDCEEKVEKRARKPWILKEMISKMDERRKWKSVSSEEGRKKYRILNNELKRATKKPSWNTLRANVMRLWNCKEQDGMI
jgi:hypothetical protein